MRSAASSLNGIPLIVDVLLLATGYTCVAGARDTTATGGQPSGPSPTCTTPSRDTLAPPAGSANGKPGIHAQARAVLNKACHELSSARTVTYHAQTTFGSVLASGVKIAVAMDTAIQRPDHLANRLQQRSVQSITVYRRMRHFRTHGNQAAFRRA
jgi:hypothetical protein